MQGKSFRRLIILVVALAAVTAATWWALWPSRAVVEKPEAVSRHARTRPDYTEIVIPPNIAPLNFVVCEDGRRFFVKISGRTGEPIEVTSRSASIRIPRRPWHSLLDANRGQDLQWEICVQSDRQWRRYQPIVNQVAKEDIDGYLVYRSIGPVYSGWSNVSIWQRNLATFENSLVIDGNSWGDGCVNCHTFAGNKPGRMFIGMRSPSLGNATLLAENGHVKKLPMRFGYTTWHPSARIVVYSANKTRQFFHAAGPEVRDVVDLKSSLAYFRIDTKEFNRVPGASDDDHLATYPTWSPDGTQLYFCRAPMLWSSQETIPPERYDDVRYDLMRVSYNIGTDRWGPPETVLSAEETGLSILLPRISPDGKFLLFCMCEYGCFPVYQPSSDLYLMNLATGEYAKCPINSPFSESWHSWSSNSRWIAFSSKRLGGTFTRCYLAFVDEMGRVHKPFIVPQEDPETYDSLLKTISAPELLTAAVQTSPEALTQAARSQHADSAASSNPVPNLDDSQPYQPMNPAHR